MVENLNVEETAKLISQHTKYVTCIKCNSFYITPLSCLCGATLCAACWQGQTSCHMCHLTFTAHSLTIANQHLAKHTQHVTSLITAFEKCFNVKMDEILGKDESNVSPPYNVIDWLANSQNNFSQPPPSNSQLSLDSQKVPVVFLSRSNLQVHATSKKLITPEKVIHLPPPPQDDWDNIEILPDTEEIGIKNKENAVGPMDIEPYFINDDEYTTENPRRSSRKRDFKSIDHHSSIEQPAKKLLQANNNDIEKKGDPTNVNWKNVKKMSREFSRLNKTNKNKLDISIETLKKNQGAIKTMPVAPAISLNTPYTIEETPQVESVEEDNENQDKTRVNDVIVCDTVNLLESEVYSAQQQDLPINKSNVDVFHHNEEVLPTLHDNSKIQQVSTCNSVPFFKKGKLQQEGIKSVTIKNSNTKMKPEMKSTNEGNPDDIYITIKIGSTVTNIVINKKHENIAFNVNTDREVQTSPENVQCNSAPDIVEHKLNKDLINTTKNHKASPTKVNTESAETRTAQYEITESVEKELSKEMECPVKTNNTSIKNLKEASTGNISKALSNEDECIEDFDIFSGSVAEGTPKMLADIKSAPSEILISTMKSKTPKSRANSKVQNTNKDSKEAEILTSSIIEIISPEHHNKSNSEQINYDEVMGEVFAKIDADIRNSQDSQKRKEKEKRKMSQSKNSPDVTRDKHSENVFTVTEKVGEIPHNVEAEKEITAQGGVDTQDHVAMLLTPAACRELCDAPQKHNQASDSETSVVEDTPQKSATSETPLTITKFVDRIKHKSTPAARKSLDFRRPPDADDDADLTLCPSAAGVAKTTQEREFMCEAFEATPEGAAAARAVHCLAGSCLSAADLDALKSLCARSGWRFVDRYVPELTHLVVGVDDGNRAQRSVKYMCALAAGKWIVSAAWARAPAPAREEPFEALDWSGAPGPRRARRARARARAAPRLFAGFTFHCVPPFSVLDADTLEGMLRAAGGRTERGAREAAAAAAAAGGGPAVVLAEPEHSQEDKFIFMAMELGVVPVNYEWVLNSLGAYRLCGVRDMLLCPAALLPAATTLWPADLLRDSDSA